MRDVQVEGIGDAQSPGAVLSGKTWQGVVFLRPWRVEGGALRKDLLRVLLRHRATSGPAMRDSAAIRTGGAYRLRLSMYPQRPGTLTSGELKGTLTRLKALPALAPADAELSRPLSLVHPVLGRLRRAPRATELQGHLRLLGRRCALLICTRPDADLERTVARAAKLLHQAARLLRSMPARIVKKMLPLANGTWAAPGARPLTSKAFLRQLRPTELTVDQEGKKLLVSFECGEVFTDHGISVTVTARSIRDIQLQ